MDSALQDLAHRLSFAIGITTEEALAVIRSMVPIYVYDRSSMFWSSGLGANDIRRLHIADEARSKHREASERATALLKEYLGKERYEQLQSQGHLDIGKYRVPSNAHSMVSDITTGDKYCLIHEDQVPNDDTVLTRIVLLEHDEELFLATANKNPCL